MSDPYGTCSNCIDDYLSLVDTYNGVSYFALSLSFMNFVLIRCVSKNNFNFAKGSIILLGLTKLVLGVLLLTAFLPDCDRVTSCETDSTCADACAEAGDPVVFYPYICLGLGFVWAVCGVSMHRTGSVEISAERSVNSRAANSNSVPTPRSALLG